MWKSAPKGVAVTELILRWEVSDTRYGLSRVLTVLVTANCYGNVATTIYDGPVFIYDNFKLKVLLPFTKNGQLALVASGVFILYPGFDC